MNLDRAQGCLLGQLAGDALGSLVEFQHPVEIRSKYPDGVREMADGGTWNTIAGQPTDDSEMALLLARLLVKKGCYDQGLALKEYQYWLNSDPFDCGMTVSAGLRSQPNFDSQANGAMMRISPLGIFGANFAMEKVATWAMADAKLTHPHPVCLQANALYAMAIAHAIKMGCDGFELYDQIRKWAVQMSIDDDLMAVINKAESEPPADYVRSQGWVMIAFQNVLFQILYAPNLEEAIVDTINKGGDTDTNAAICGALVGALHGRKQVPDQWLKALQSCRPEEKNPKVHHPRPECFWPVDALELAESLLNVSRC